MGDRLGHGVLLCSNDVSTEGNPRIASGRLFNISKMKCCCGQVQSNLTTYAAVVRNRCSFVKKVSYGRLLQTSEQDRLTLITFGHHVYYDLNV